MKTLRILLNILLALALAASMVACGNKGSLVHPDQTRPAEESAPAN